MGNQLIELTWVSLALVTAIFIYLFIYLLA